MMIKSNHIRAGCVAVALLVPAAATANETVTYTYDARGRLIEVDRAGTVNNGVSTAYTLDKADNRTNKTTTGATPLSPSLSIGNASTPEGGNLSFTDVGSVDDSSTADPAIAGSADAATRGSSSFPSGETTLDDSGRIVALSNVSAGVPGGLAVREGPHGRDELFVGDMFTLRTFEVAGGEARLREVEHIRFLDPASMITVQSVSNAANGSDLILSTWFFGGGVQIWDPVSHTAVATYQDLAFPLNAIAFDGDIAVAELATGRVLRLSDRSILGSGFTVPTGLAAIGRDLYAADFATGAVAKIVDNGTPLPAPVVVATGLAAPEGLTVDTDGGLLVAETGIGRISKIDVTTGTVTTVAAGLALGNDPVIPFIGPPTSPTWLGLTTVVVSPTSNDLYVAGVDSDKPHRKHAGVIYRIKR